MAEANLDGAEFEGVKLKVEVGVYVFSALCYDFCKKNPL